MMHVFIVFGLYDHFEIIIVSALERFGPSRFSHNVMSAIYGDRCVVTEVKKNYE